MSFLTVRPGGDVGSRALAWGRALRRRPAAPPAAPLRLRDPKMSLSSGPAGEDSGAVEAYDSGDEWDIGVGNLIIDLDADLEKDKLEMSSGKEGGGAMAAPGGAVPLPDNIKFVSPAGGAQGKDSKSKAKRSKNSKEGAKAPGLDGAKKEVRGRPPGDPPTHNPNPTTPPKGSDKSSKPCRALPAVKKDKDGLSVKIKKEKLEVVCSGGLGPDKDCAPLPTGGPYEGQQDAEAIVGEQLGNVDPPGEVEHEEEEELEEEEEEEEEEGEEGEEETVCVKMESPVSTPAPPAPPLHLLAPVPTSTISSPCEQIMVRTRSVAVNTADAALGTEPECLGPCEPGTSVNLEGIVWQETEDGMLVVNVTWRNKTYVGTLLDCTRHDWAPPRYLEPGRGTSPLIDI
ncbi:Zinc finger protein 609 [Liparis tanakae]|uniref:Zinc finger protein 609 n=1 Tax=Liparis tanakae TaxID=230148 RepID=A0A4Z2GVB9_9TELE|nr:Zinc finger protein 609 [Liparis tanakae]